MKNLFTKTSLAAVTLAAVTLAAPVAAHAGDYKKCKDTDNAIAGGLIGGTLGSVVGKEIASRDDNTEGAILGAIIGGIAGSAIGDGVNDCEKYNTRRRTGYTTVPSRGYSSRRAVVTNVAHHGGYGSYGNGGNYGYNDYNRGRGYGQLNRINRRIDNLRRERSKIKRRHHLSRWEYRRLDEIGYQLADLKRQSKRIKRNARNYREYDRGYSSRRGHYHGSSRDVCYSDH